MKIGQITPRILEEEMRQSYLDYAMSVIVARALPDVRDGLKPVQRRILYGMHLLGLRANSKFVKSARIAGDVVGKFHPHGDIAVYDALVRLAQEFSMRYLLVDGQGNFGSVDGDAAAAMRYTEARLTRVAEEMLADIDKETVSFVDNYDGTLKEPKLLPARVPQLLLNGTVGIAVGMATNIPPHNLGEVMSGLIKLIDQPQTSLNDLMEEVRGPDFPTGGVIFNPEEIKAAYQTGKGRVVMRAVAEIEESAKGNRILVTELPFQVNKATLLERIADLVKEKKIIGIADIRDESDRKGIQIVIELKKDAYPKKVLNQLFKMTALQSVFHVNLLALVDGLQPRVLDLKTILQLFIDFRREIVARRTAFELERARERAHVLDGLKIALDNLDAVITTIRRSEDRNAARLSLIKRFKLSEVQANAILDMKLSALAALERKRVEDELKEKKELIKALKATLDDPKKISAVVKEEFEEVRQKFTDPRRTKISVKTIGQFADTDLIPNEEVVVTLTKGGYIKRQPTTAYKAQHRGGKGVIGIQTKEEDLVDEIQIAKNHNDILFFTTKGRVFRQKVYEVPLASRLARGTALVNLIQVAPDEKITSSLTISRYYPTDFLMAITAKGFVKKTKLVAFEKIRSSGLMAIRLDTGDELRWVRYARPQEEVIITTKEGQAIRFKESEVRPMGRAARGVRGIRLREKDEVVGADLATPDSSADVLAVSSKGFGKRTPLTAYSLQRRGGVGVKTIKVTNRVGRLKGASLVIDPDSDLIVISARGQVIRLSLKSIPVLRRATQGVTIIRLQPGDSVAAFTVLSRADEEGKVGAKEETSPPPVKKEERLRLPQPREAEATFRRRRISLPARQLVVKKSSQRKPKKSSVAPFKRRKIKVRYYRQAKVKKRERKSPASKRAIKRGVGFRLRRLGGGKRPVGFKLRALRRKRR